MASTDHTFTSYLFNCGMSMSVEAENAVMRERARIREAVVKLLMQKHGHVELIKRSEVLAILKP